MPTRSNRSDRSDRTSRSDRADRSNRSSRAGRSSHSDLHESSASIEEEVSAARINIADIQGTDMDRFTEVMEPIFKWEGGFVDNPFDNGGPTNMGITHKALARWRGVSDVSRDDVKALTRDEAEAIFRHHYWDKIRGDELPEVVDLVVMDGAVNHGPRTVSKFLQRVLERSETGNLTNADIAALNQKVSNPGGDVEVAIAIAEMRKARYENHEDAIHFLKGWRNRLNDIMKHALAGSGSSWDFDAGTEADGSASIGTTMTSYVRPHIEDDDLQIALKAYGTYSDAIDGIFGQNSITAMRSVLSANSSRVSGNWASWSVSRQKIALGQLICHDTGIDAGAIDGLFGPVTEEAFIKFNRRANSQPVDLWRDEIEEIPDSWQPTPSSSTWPTEADVPTFFGPRCSGVPFARLELPFKMQLAWDLSVEISGFSIHSMVRDSAARVFDKVYAHYGDDGVEDLGLNLFGGCYNCRKKKGGSSWSMHSWAIAIDFDPTRNKLKWNHTQARLAKPDAVKFWEFWEAEGWVSLGRTRDFDWMHVQAARR